jgi:hypothetical protein
VTLEAVELVHRIVGYPLAFIVGPWALASFAGAPGHRWSGKAYAIAMTFLYLTGTSLTLTRHPWGTWEFGRNVAFNLFGYSLLLHGFRAMWLLNNKDAKRPVALDYVLLAAMLGLAAMLAILAVQRSNSPMHVFAALALVLAALEIRDWRTGLTAKALYARHVRYMLGSYFYVLTVVSIVHLRDELTNDARWMWPSVLGAATLWLVGESKRTTRWTMRLLLAISVAFGAYVAWEVARDHGHVERMLGAGQHLLDAGDVVQVQA